VEIHTIHRTRLRPHRTRLESFAPSGVPAVAESPGVRRRIERARERERERQSKASPNFGESKIAIPDPTEKAKRERKSGRFLPLDRKLP
jgi:hypothetical protein